MDDVIYKVHTYCIQLHNSLKPLYRCIDCIIGWKYNKTCLLLKVHLYKFFSYIFKSCIGYVLSVHVNGNNQEEE